MSDKQGDILDLAIGNRVYDREKDNQTGLVVVDAPDELASERRIQGTGKTVADYNEEYPADSRIVTVVFQEDLWSKLDDWAELEPDELQTQVQDISIRQYDYPVPRLVRQTTSLPKEVETYHQLICYQNARLIQLAAGVPHRGFLWKRYGQLKDGEYEMASITKEDKYQLQEDFGVCIYCKEETETTFDHVIPLAQGGADNISNQVPACQSCNSSKSDQDVIEWCKQQGRAVPRIVWGKYLKQFEEQLTEEGRIHDELPEDEREKWNGVELQRNITDRVYKRYSRKE